MSVKGFVVCAAVASLAASSFAAPARRSSQQASSSNRSGLVRIIQEPKLGQQTCLSAPSVPGASLIGMCNKKPRRWIVLETKYETYGTNKSKCIDQLVFTWHVLLETRSATENRGNEENLPPYSYFTAATAYANIPAGGHASSVVLPPSYLERFGTPKAVGLEISNQNGEVLYHGSWSEIKGIVPGNKFWEDQKIMEAQANGRPMIERRQGLLDRSKTIWALVFPNDYEALAQ